MSIIKSEFALALNQVATERGISPDDVVASIELAILAAYHKETLTPLEEQEETIQVKVNRDNGEARLFEDGKDITPAGFGRIATQTAKQVILQKIREVEKKTVIAQFKNQMGNMIRGRVIRYDGYNAYVDIGRTEAVLPMEEQIKNEKYEVNTSQVFLLKELSDDKFGNSRIVVSRTAPALIAKLFEKEVPEISNGTVEVKKVVRAPGERAKIAVHSSQGGVDPVGACVGQKGVRVQTVTSELGGDEKIDIIQWNRDEKLFLISALSPAKIINVELDIEGKNAKVTVDETQAPLAIGKGGVNVNLASQLTGYNIDIVQVASAAKTAEDEATSVPAETKVEEPAKVEPQEAAPVEEKTEEAQKEEAKEAAPEQETAKQVNATPAEEPAPAKPAEQPEPKQEPEAPSQPEEPQPAAPQAQEPANTDQPA